MNMQKEMQKQMSIMVAAPVMKEGKRVEAALGRCMEKAVRANSDALWARFQEEHAQCERVGKDQMQQMANLITNIVNKDLPAISERILKKEISAVGPTVVRAITPVISSAITESFQVFFLSITPHPCGFCLNRKNFIRIPLLSLEDLTGYPCLSRT